MHTEEDMAHESVCECGHHLNPGDGACGACGKKCSARPAASSEGETKSMPVRVLVAKCFKTKAVFAHVVPQKGVDPERYAVERLAKDV